LQNKKTKALISSTESNDGIPSILTQRGNTESAGTYAHEDVAFAYAACIAHKQSLLLLMMREREKAFQSSSSRSEQLLN